MSEHANRSSLRTPIIVGIIASIAELACILFVHGSHRAAVRVVSGQAARIGSAPVDFGLGLGADLTGWLVVAAQMASVLVLPPVIFAVAVRLIGACILHVIANRAFQRRAAVR